MRKIYSIVAMATCVFAAVSCSNEDETVSKAPQNQKIGFGVIADGSVVARGNATTSANMAEKITSFQTWAYDAVANSLYIGDSNTAGREVSKVGENWTYTPLQYWPTNALSFVALTPTAKATSTTTTCSEGVVALAADITVPTNVEDTQDYMFAEGNKITKDTDNGKVPFTFKHGVSQIVFKGKLGSSGAVTKATVKEITLVNVKSHGIVNFSSDGTFGEITSLETPVDYTLSDTQLTNSVIEGADAMEITQSNGDKSNAWFLLPQVLDGSGTLVKAGGAAPADGKTYIKICAKLEKDGVVILNDTDAIYIPVGTTWERSKKYIYTLEFNGTGALDPISFTVAAEDWTDVNVDPSLGV